jgi:hypothetical protein
LLNKCEGIKAYFITEEKEGEYNPSTWSDFGVAPEDMRQAFSCSPNVIIEVCMQLTKEFLIYIKSKNIKIIKYEMSNKYVLSMEKMLAGSELMSNSNEAVFDEIWTTPQHVNTCKSFLKYDYNCDNFSVVPHVWSPMFIEYAFSLTNSDIIGYHSTSPEKRIGVFEPNLNIVKTAVFPMIIINNAYKKDPKNIKEVWITNTTKMKDNKKFVRLANKMIPDNKSIASFESRYKFARFASQHTDIVVTHQWENGLNYLYCEALYLKYPLVHNSTFFKDTGYYYPNFDADLAGDALLDAINNHDKNIDEYNKKCEEMIWRHSIDNPEIIELHRNKILEAIK